MAVSSKGKWRSITGAASGIGLATVERFLRDGAAVVLADNQAALLETRDGPAEGAGGAWRRLGDGRDEVGRRPPGGRGGRRGVRQARRPLRQRRDRLHGRAGRHDRRGLGPRQWTSTPRASSSAPARRSARCSRRRPSNGSVILNGSISGLAGIPKQAPYAPSKGAVVEMTRQLAVEYCGAGRPGQLRLPGDDRDAAPAPRGWRVGRPRGVQGDARRRPPDRPRRPARGDRRGRGVPRLRRRQLHHRGHPAGRRRLHGPT